MRMDDGGDDGALPYGAQVAASLHKALALSDAADGAGEWCAPTPDARRMSSPRVRRTATCTLAGGAAGDASRVCRMLHVWRSRCPRGLR